jgi:hypothetical protein
MRAALIAAIMCAAVAARADSVTPKVESATTTPHGPIPKIVDMPSAARADSGPPMPQYDPRSICIEYTQLLAPNADDGPGMTEWTTGARDYSFGECLSRMAMAQRKLFQAWNQQTSRTRSTCIAWMKETLDDPRDSSSDQIILRTNAYGLLATCLDRLAAGYIKAFGPSPELCTAHPDWSDCEKQSEPDKPKLSASTDKPKLPSPMRDQLIAILQKQFKACYKAPPGVEPKPGVVPTIQIQFSGPDGSLAGRPLIENPPSDPGTRILTEAMARAITRCAPYSIPVQFSPFFDEWRDVIIPIHFVDSSEASSCGPLTPLFHVACRDRVSSEYAACECSCRNDAKSMANYLFNTHKIADWEWRRAYETVRDRCMKGMS